jgi:hypothetical protein
MDENDLVYRLRKRAEIRRQISTRKSVQEGKPDRIADLLEEAADYIDAVNMSQERVDETEKCKHGPVAWVKEEWYVDDVGLQNTREVLYGYEVYGGKPLCTAPPKREWVGLTDADIDAYALDEGVTANKAPPWLVKYARDIEAKLKEKNT